MVPPPGRVSTTTGWPHASVKSWPISRATTSTEPPGANGTMIGIGFVGQLGAGACARRGERPTRRAANRKRTVATERRDDPERPPFMSASRGSFGRSGFGAARHGDAELLDHRTPERDIAGDPGL